MLLVPGCSFSTSAGFDVTGVPNIDLNGWFSAGLGAAFSVAGLGVANILPNAGEALDSFPASVVFAGAGVPKRDLNGCVSAGFEAAFSAAGLGVANMFPNAGDALVSFPASNVFDTAGVPNIGLNGCVSAAFPALSVPVTFEVDKLANGLLAADPSVAGLGANGLLAGSDGLEVEVDPKRPLKGLATSAGLAGVCSAAGFGANKLALDCPERFANGLLAAAPSEAGFGANGLLTAGFDFASSGFEAAGAPKRGLKGWGSAELAAACSVEAGFGAKMLEFCPERLANGLAGADPPVGGLAAKIEAPLGLVSGDVCMLSSAGEVMCAVDWPNRPELAGLLAGVLVFCWAPNPPNDGAV